MKNITVKDHTVSGESFQLVYDEVYDMYKTHPQPKVEDLPSYYQSEDYISHTDTQRNLFEKVYHWVRSYMLRRKISIVEKHTEISEKTILDVGCGTGDFLKMAQENGWKVNGVEPDSSARRIASEKNPGKVHDNLWLESLPENQFDAITMWHVLEHVPNVKEQISLLKKIVKENGTIFTAVPNFRSYDAKHYKGHWAAYDVPRHLSHFSQKAIQKLFSEQQMKVVKILPMKFDAYYVSLLSEKIKHKKINPLKGLYQGFISNWKATRTSEYSSLIFVIKNQ